MKIPNWFKGAFLHKEKDREHFPIERYSGLTCIGYKCNGCSYEWHKPRKRDNSNNKG